MLLAAGFWHAVAAIFFTAFAILLMLVILLQRGRGVGLAGAFGGAGPTAAFGAKTGDVLTLVTIVGFGIFVLFAVLLNFAFRPSGPSLGIPAVIDGTSTGTGTPTGTGTSTGESETSPASDEAPEGALRIITERPALARGVHIFGESFA